MVDTPDHLVARFGFANIRGFQDLEVNLRDESNRPHNRLLVIGRNGTCKTTLLRAIAIGLCDRSDANFLAGQPHGGFVRHGEEKARIEIELTDPGGANTERRSQELERSGEKEFVEVLGHGLIQRPQVGEGEPRFSEPFVCGYGAGRHGVAVDPGREYRTADSVGSLFDYQRELLAPELILRRLRDFLDSHGYSSTLRGIKRVLRLQDEDEIRAVKGGGVELSGPSVGSPVPLEAWADGHRMTFSWLLDVYGWAMRAERIDDEGHVHGIVLVDELDQHLHPSMLPQMLKNLAEVLPHVQLIATTHSPLLALGAAPQELLVLQRNGSGIQVGHPPDFSNYSAEDMLEDERLFDTLAYSAETEARLRTYHRLAAIPKERRSGSESEELSRLARELQAQQLAPADDSEAARELRDLRARHGL